MTLAELLPFVAIAVGFWLLLIRPVRRRRAEQAKLVAALAPGQRIMTTAGLFGTVRSIDAERVRVDVAPGVVIEMLAVAVAQIVPAEPGDASGHDPSADREPHTIVLDPPSGSDPTRPPGEESDRG